VYISVGILETKRTNSRHNIKIYVKEIKLKAVEWIHLAQNSVEVLFRFKHSIELHLSSIDCEEFLII
jgi:hypothetical protein